MEPTTQPSSKTRVVLIVLGVVVALVILISSGYAVFMAAQPKKVENNQTSQKSTATVTSSDFKAGIDKLSNIAEQEKTNRAKAQAAYDDTQKRIKLSN